MNLFILAFGLLSSMAFADNDDGLEPYSSWHDADAVVDVSLFGDGGNKSIHYSNIKSESCEVFVKAIVGTAPVTLIKGVILTEDVDPEDLCVKSDQNFVTLSFN